MTITHTTTPAGTSVLDDLGLDPGFTVKAKLAIVSGACRPQFMLLALRWRL